jgi:hypothetical protein
MRLLAVLAAVLLHGAAVAQDESKEAPASKEALAALFRDNHDAVTELVNALSRCVALYNVLATMTPNKPATTENLKGLGRGARFSALYLLGQESVWTGHDPKPYGEFAPYVDAITETATSYLLSLAENNEEPTFSDEVTKCTTLAKTQESLVQMMRDELAGR